MQAAYRKLTRPVNFYVVFLMVIGYVLMGCMMAEQNRTISAQRELIRKLFQDSVRLSVTKADTSKQQARPR
jgi:hypothetical protein